MLLRQGIVARDEKNVFGYFGWGSVGRIDENTLACVCSANRLYHICPFGKNYMYLSRDEGKTWSCPTVVNDTFMDDRDTGILDLGNGKLLVSWFSNELHYIDRYSKRIGQKLGDGAKKMIDGYMEAVSDRESEHGSFVKLSSDGGFTWSDAVRVPVTSPHGPTVLKNGKILYFGKNFDKPGISAYESDDGKVWTLKGEVPIPTIEDGLFCEPHAVELPNGDILGMIRYQNEKDGGSFGKSLSMFQTVSKDGGKTWSAPEYTDVSGSPPHLLVHSSGAVICVYGRRAEPYGERAMISRDNGKTWEKDIVISDYAKDSDLGYPASAELKDGSILTVYYQKYKGDDRCSMLYSVWTLD